MFCAENLQKFYFEKAYKIYFYLFVIFLLFQLFFWTKAQDIKVEIDIVPQVPNKYLVPVLSLGDEEFLFRALSYRLQNSGDVFAGFVSLRRYDYQRLYDWFIMLDSLNSTSHFIPYLASYYYAMTPNRQDTIHIVNYLSKRAKDDLDRNWWWLFQAVVIAKRELKDDAKALELAYQLSKTQAENAPLWVKQYPAFLLAQQGEACESFRVIERILAENESGLRQISVEEMSFMNHFISVRLAELKKSKFDPRKCKNL